MYFGVWYYLNTSSNNLCQVPYSSSALILSFCLLHCDKQRIKYSCLSYTESPQTGGSPDSRCFFHTTSCVVRVCPALFNISIQYQYSVFPRKIQARNSITAKPVNEVKVKTGEGVGIVPFPAGNPEIEKHKNQQMAEHQLKSHLSGPQLSSTVINLPRQL